MLFCKGGVVCFESLEERGWQDQVQKFAHRAVLFDRVPQVNAGVDQVGVTAAMLDAGQDARLVEMRDQSLCAALGNADAIGNLAQTSFGVFGQAHEDVRVVAEECPVVLAHGTSTCCGYRRQTIIGQT